MLDYAGITLYPLLAFITVTMPQIKTGGGVKDNCCFVFNCILISCFQSEMQTKTADHSSSTEELRSKVNQLQVENADLQAEVVKLRYSPHPEIIREKQQVTVMHCPIKCILSVL